VLIPANTATRIGAPTQIPNFYKKPNGVFYVADGEAGVLETGKFLAQRLKANCATQRVGFEPAVRSPVQRFSSSMILILACAVQ
jgi:hypothetical protein